MPTGEPIGKDYETLMPDLTDIADIQEAFKMYHYGLTSYTGVEVIPAESIEGHFDAVNTRVTDLENRPIGGGELNTSEPVTVGVDNLPVPDGYIWVDSDANVSAIPEYANIIYSPTEPTGLGPTDAGTIWIDEDGSAAVLNVNNYQLLTQVSSSATATQTGQMWLDTNGNVLKIYNGTSWIDATSLVNKIFNGGSFTGSITNSATITGGTFSNSTINSASVTSGTISSSIIDNATITNTNIVLPIISKTSNYTLATDLSDAGKMIEMNNASPLTLTIPSDSVANYPIGTQIVIHQIGAGQVTLAGATTPQSVTLNGAPGLKIRSQWSSATLVKRGTNLWVALGNLTA